MRKSDNIKRGEILFESKAAHEQRIERLQFHPTRSYQTDTFYRWRIDIMNEFLNPKEGDMILDLGAASCEISEFFAHQGCIVAAIDISPDMLMLGKERIFHKPTGEQIKILKGNGQIKPITKKVKMIKWDPRETLHCTLGDCERLPYRSDTFDKIICWATLHHMPNPDVTLNEVVRVLKKDGKCLIFEPNALNIFRRLQEVTWSATNLETSFYPWDLRIMLNNAGLEVKSLSYIRPSISIAFNESNSIYRAIKIVYSKISKQNPYKYLFGELTALCVPKND